MLAIDLRAQNKNKMLEEFFKVFSNTNKNEYYYTDTNSFSPLLGNSLVSKSYSSMDYYFF